MVLGYPYEQTQKKAMMNKIRNIKVISNIIKKANFPKLNAWFNTHKHNENVIVDVRMYFLNDKIVFPSLSESSAEGLLAIGGDLSTERLLYAYQNGIFPWFDEAEPILW